MDVRAAGVREVEAGPELVASMVPGRSAVALRPHARGTTIPASSETRNVKPPNPVILQTTLISLPAGGGTGLKNSAPMTSSWCSPAWTW